MLSWFSDGALAESDASRSREMTAVNSGLHEVPGVRLPLQTTYGSPSPHAVFMYSTGAEGSVTLQLRDADDLDDKSGLASVLARLQQEDATLSISYQDSEVLAEGSIDVLLGAGALHASGNGGTTATFDLFDSESGQDLTLSPQTFTSSTEAFINDNSDSLGVPGDTDTVGSTEDAKGVADSSKLAVKKPRPKASSPNRQGPQQCQVCGKVFGNASALAKHKLTHSDERKYVCSMCGKAFKRQDHLNGHMLTHRNKKPYECKAEGCGKSYCDARSLRRHTENHHTSSGGSGGSGGGGVAQSSGEEASPLAASCIQYAPPPAASAAPPPPYPAAASPASKQAPSQLQQLLASEPAAAPASSPAPTAKAPSSSPNNDGLTKQQLDLIHQIMQQTQQQAAAHHKQQQAAAAAKPGSGAATGGGKAAAATPAKTRPWNVQSSSVGATKANGAGQQPAGGAATAGAAKPHQQQQQQQDPKPVECNLCHRKFKNIPALNGHMRLHGGYFKKDSESKKCEKKEVTGPPLQTASMSVRALIEEKIIQKRITNNPAPAQPPQLTYSGEYVSAGSVAHAELVQKRITNIQLNSPVPAAQPEQLAYRGDYGSVEHSLTSEFIQKRITNLNLNNPAPAQLPQLTYSGEYASAGSVGYSLNSESIQKRITNLHLNHLAPAQLPQLTYTGSEPNNSPRTTAPPQYPNTSPGAAAKDQDLNIKLSSFVVPAPPPQSAPSAGEKLRRHSDSEHFVPPRAPGDVPEAMALAELLLKRGGKVAVKRASSDPGPQQLQLSFPASDGGYSLGVGVTYQAEDGGYFSPSLQEDVFQQVSVQDTMLLHGVDPAQLAESIQFQAASLLQDQATAEQLQDIASLEDYQSAGLSDGVHQQSHHGVPQDFQAVLNSPLPDFSSYGTQGRDLASHSPLQHSQGVSFGHSPLTTQSPLPSPLTHHDSPGFTYPTPPASQEGQSPSFGHGSLVTGSLPLASPHADGYVQSVIAHVPQEPPPPVSSPLSAAFYTSTMSSSAAVEAALSEVLPGESMGQQPSHLRSHNLGIYQSLVNPSPPPQSPLSATPVPSPLSLSSVPASSSSVSSPLPPQGQVSFPLSPHHALQSQMMPNSEDPLLSSSPKDFGSRKKFDFGGIHSFKLIGNGMVDFGVPAGSIVVDSNGELKFVQASNHMHHHHHHHTQPKANLCAYQRKSEPAPPRATQYLSGVRSQRPKMHVALDGLKEEGDDDVFLSPTSIPASPIRAARKKARPEPLYIPPHPHATFQSRLRSPRLRDASAASPPPPYTPPPMLSPARAGQGLFWQAATSGTPAPSWPSSTTLSQGKNGSGDCSDDSQHGPSLLPGVDCAPESDATPHINVGPSFQCSLPQWNPDREKADREPSYEHLLWDPGIAKVCSDAEVEMYLEFACCAAVPGGGRNKEYALHLLHMCRGNIHEAMLKLMQPTPALPPGHPLLAYEYTESDRWSAEEMDMFHQGLLKYDKDFRSISQEIGSKTMKQCVQFYYVWKKVCPEEYKRLRLVRRRQNADYTGRLDMDFEDIKTEDSRHSIPASDVELVSTSSESRLFVCEYPDCSASFNSRAALNGHIRIHGGGVCGRSPTPDKRPATATPPTLGDILEEFPCKICGKVFNKVKSRSAHMKSHRPPDAEPKKPKLDPHKMEATEQSLGRAMGVTTTIGLTARHA